MNTTTQDEIFLQLAQSLSQIEMPMTETEIDEFRPFVSTEAINQATEMSE